MTKTITKLLLVPDRPGKQILRIMRLTTVFLLAVMMQVSATTLAQKVTLAERDLALSKVFVKISKQTGYDFWVNSTLLKGSKPVTISVTNAQLEEVLKAVFKDQPLTYTIEDKVVTVSRKAETGFFEKVLDALTAPIDVSGTVLDEKGLPLIGATVKVKGFQQSTTTDAQGKFSLQGVDDKAVLVISYIGYASKEVAAKVSVSVSLEIQSAELQEVNVAYGKTTQQALTGSVTVIKGEQIQNLPNRSVDKSLQGLVPGLQVTGGTGQPGGGVASFLLRGVATGVEEYAGVIARNPLIVIDGVPVSQEAFQTLKPRATAITNPMAQLNPSDIESISVLKDAAAIALYGAKASNGVILITTKKGKEGKTTFNLRSQTDFSQRSEGNLKFLNQDQYLQLLFETYKATDPVVWTDDKIIADLKSKFPTRSDGGFYPAADWNKAIYDKNAITTTNEIAMSGGNDKSIFYINAEYLKQNGIIKATGYDRKSLRFNFENQPSKSLKIGLNSTLSHNIQKFNDVFESSAGAGAGKIISPLNPVRNEMGDYIFVYPLGLFGNGTLNPEAQAKFNINTNTSYRGLANLYGELKFLKSVTLKSILGFDYMLNNEKMKVSPVFAANSDLANNPSISERDVTRGSVINTNTLAYHQTFSNDHNLTALFGQESQVMTQRELGADVRGTKETLPFYDEMSSQGYQQSGYTGMGTRQTQLSFFAQLNYGFKGKYYLTASSRADGSSRFGDQQRWGKFWSTGFGWVMSNESFLKGTDTWLSYLKIRGSIGAAGNSSAINRFTRFTTLATFRYDDNQAVSTAGNPANPDVRWEQTDTWDLGLETRFFNNRLSISADTYSRYTSDLIYSTNLTSVTGFPSVLANIGDMRNSGVELSANVTPIQSKTFSWNIIGNWSTNTNRLIKANVPLTRLNSPGLGNEEGRNFNSFYMPVWAGVNPSDGKPQWFTSTGGTTSVYSQAALQFVGKPQPDGFGSIGNTISYKNFQLSTSVYYQYGYKLYDDQSGYVLQNDGQFPFYNQTVDALDHWRKPGDISPNPRRILNNTDNPYFAKSTRFLHVADYIKLQNVSISYNLPKNFISRAKLNALKIYADANNIATFTRFKGGNPDNTNMAGSAGFNYPNARTFSVGLNANF